MNGAINVTMVVPFLSRAGGGLFDATRRLAQELAALPHTRVRAVGPGDTWTSTDQPLWAPIETCALNRVGPKGWGFTPALRSTLTRQTPDVIHHHGLWTLSSLTVSRLVRGLHSSAANSRRTALIVSTHGMADRWALAQSKTKKTLAWHAYQRSHLQHAACILVASESEGRALRDKGLLGPIVVIPNGVDTPVTVSGDAPWRAKITPERNVLLFLGRLHHKKGVLELLRAWANTIASNEVLRTQWSLVVTGWDDGGLEAEVRSLARQLALGPANFWCSGPLYGKDRDLALHHSSALILPSYSEGMPMAVLEGMAFGLPVLISKACNLPQVYEHDAGLCADPTPQSLVAALNALSYLTLSQRRAMGARGRELANTVFSWRAVAQSTLQVYGWVLEPGSLKPQLTWL
jgi:glycosyltransferase involved in cell wall biosynthesis